MRQPFKTMPVLAALALSLAACSTSDPVTDTTPTSSSTATAPDPAGTVPETAETTEPAAEPSTTAPETSAPATEPEGLSDGSFSSEEPMVKDDGLGSLGGTARVTNTSDSGKTAVFTYTVFVDGAQVGTLQGSAADVEAGSTSTVQLVSTDPIVDGPYTFEFQVDTEF